MHVGENRIKINLLGPVEIISNTQVITLRGTKTRTLLAALALAEGRPVQDSRICFYLWGSRPPATRTAQVYTYVSRLRAQVDADLPIARHAASYQLAADGVEVDALRFGQLAHRGLELLDRGEPAEAAAVIEEALTWWRGPAMMDTTEQLQAAAGTALDALRLDVIEARAEALLQLNRHHQLTYELPTVVAEHPGRERLRAQLMIALHRSDRQTEALQLYHAGRRALADEFGVDPGRCLTSAYLTVLNGAPASSNDQLVPVPIRSDRRR